MKDDVTKLTANHAIIKKWVEQRGGYPVKIESGKAIHDESGIVQITFTGKKNTGKMHEITWKEFFTLFDQAHLAFLYQEKTPEGSLSHYFKIVSRNGE